MSMEGCERVNFMREETTRVVSTYSPLFEGDVKVVKRGDFEQLFEMSLGESGRPQRPSSVTSQGHRGSCKVQRATTGWFGEE